MNTLFAHVLAAYQRLMAPTRNEEGASLVEYALLVGLIAVVCIGAVTFVGGSAASKFSSIGSSIQ
jgi:pilus assembly protein Flp/PilA